MSERRYLSRKEWVALHGRDQPTALLRPASDLPKCEVCKRRPAVAKLADGRRACKKCHELDLLTLFPDTYKDPTQKDRRTPE